MDKREDHLKIPVEEKRLSSYLVWENKKFSDSEKEKLLIDNTSKISSE